LSRTLLVVTVYVVSLSLLLLMPSASAGNIVVNTTHTGLVASDADANVSIMSTAPVAAFAGTPTFGLKPLIVTFTDSTKGSITSELWEYKLQSDSAWIPFTVDSSSSFCFSNTGIYDVRLTVTDKGGSNTKTELSYIKVNEAAPVAAFSGSPQSGSKPLNVAFRNESTGLITSFTWNFGDGTSSAEQNPTHRYTTGGSYFVNLTVTGPWGSDFENKTNYITVTNATTKIGIYKDGVWNLKNSEGISDLTFVYGQPGDIPVVGDWTGSGNDTVGIYRNGAFYLRNSNSNGFADMTFGYGNPAGDIPLAGDWTGSGNDTIGVFRNGVFYLRNSNSNGFADRVFTYGQQGDVPVTGDWNGDGKTEVGVFRDGVWYLDYNGDGVSGSSANLIYTFLGETGWTPVVGDWNGNGPTKIGVYKAGTLYLDYNGNGVWDSGSDKGYNFGLTSDYVPVVGDWNGDGKTKTGFYRWGFWSLDYNGEGTISEVYTFIGEDVYDFIPVVGDWNGDGKAKIGMYQYTTGNWSLDYNGNGEWDAGTDKGYHLGGSGWTPVVGDWNGDGKAKTGVFKDGAWHLDSNGNGSLINVYSFGTTGSTPIRGDWNGDGKAKIGVFKDGAWRLDSNGNGAWDAGTDKEYSLGATGYIPVTGRWS
jgi:PKD repeat protein